MEDRRLQTQQEAAATTKRPRAAATLLPPVSDEQEIRGSDKNVSAISGVTRAMNDLDVNKENKDDAVDLSIAEIHAALTTKQRLVALKHLQQMLLQMQKHQTSAAAPPPPSENIDSARLLEAGLVNALSLQLHRLLNRHGSTPTEMELLCHCLSLVLERCRKLRSELQQCIQEQGTPLIDMLTQATGIHKQQHHRHQQQRPSSNSSSTSRSTPCVLQSVLSLFHIISSSSVGTTLLLQSQDVGHTLVTSLSNSNAPDAIVLEALATLKNMTYYDEDCRVILVKLPGFLSALTSLPYQHRRPLSNKSRQRLSAVVRNLATSTECRAILIRQPALIGLLARLLSTSENDSDDDWPTVQEYHAFRRNILNTLICLAMDQEWSLLLLLHCDGILVRRLQRLLRDKNDESARRNAARILRLLAHEASIQLLVHDKDLMHQLSDAALLDPSATVRQEATEAFARCAALAQAEPSQPAHYESVLDALQLLVQQQQSRAVSHDVLAQTLREQAMRAGNRKLLGKRRILLQTITKIALERGVSSTMAVRDACSTLMYLSMEESNRQGMVQVPDLLDALLNNLSSFSRGDHQEERKDALQTLANLALSSANHEPMAKHSCLLSTLIQFTGKMNNDDELKADLKRTILLLAKAL